MAARSFLNCPFCGTQVVLGSNTCCGCSAAVRYGFRPVFGVMLGVTGSLAALYASGLPGQLVSQVMPERLSEALLRVLAVLLLLAGLPLLRQAARSRCVRFIRPPPRHARPAHPVAAGPPFPVT